MSRNGASFFSVASGSFLCSVKTGGEQVGGLFELARGAMSGFFFRGGVLGAAGK